MPGMTGLEQGEASGGSRGFIKATSGRRAVVIVAGGVLNLILAGAVFSGVAAFGGPSPQIQKGGALAGAGATGGYQIVGIEHRRVTSLTAIRSLIQKDSGNPLRVALQPWGGGTQHSYTVTPQLHWIGTAATPKIPFEAQIVAIDGRAVPHANSSSLASAVPGTGPLTVTYLSGTKRVSVQVARSALQLEWLVGYLDSAGNPLLPSLGGKPLPWYQAIAVGFYAVPTQIGAIFVNLWTLLSPHHNPNLRLSGPVGIAEETSVATQISASLYVTLLGLISLNLGLFNLLPIPFLDGGRLAGSTRSWKRRFMWLG
jgi:membrane-associated protease RseP (regulator of RpoE activity)